MCAMSFLGKLPPYRLHVSCMDSVGEGIQLHLRLESRASLQLPHILRAHFSVVAVSDTVVELQIDLRGPLPLMESGTPGNTPAAVVYNCHLPKGVNRCRCTLCLGRRRQSFVLLLEPPRVRGYVEADEVMPLAELVLP